MIEGICEIWLVLITDHDVWQIKKAQFRELTLIERQRNIREENKRNEEQKNIKRKSN